MTSIIVHCTKNYCESTLAPENVILALVSPGHAEYSFWCGKCGTFAVKDASPDAVDLLAKAGLRPTMLAPEYTQHDGPCLTERDVEHFRRSLLRAKFPATLAKLDVHRVPTADAGGAS